MDAENRRRGFRTSPAPAASAHTACGTSSSTSRTSHPYPSHLSPQSADSPMRDMPSIGGQQKRARNPEAPAQDGALLFVRPWCREQVRVGRAAAVRKYVAASYSSMWERTQSSLANNRHFYEIVRESTPCHIYFDLEFATAENRDLDGNPKVDCLLNIVASLVKCASLPFTCTIATAAFAQSALAWPAAILVAAPPSSFLPVKLFYCAGLRGVYTLDQRMCWRWKA